MEFIATFVICFSERWGFVKVNGEDMQMMEEECAWDSVLCFACTSFSYVLLRLIGKHDRIRTAPVPLLLSLQVSRQYSVS